MTERATEQLEEEHAPDCNDYETQTRFRGIQGESIIQWFCPDCNPDRVQQTMGIPDGFVVVESQDSEQLTLQEAVTDGGIERTAGRLSGDPRGFQAWYDAKWIDCIRCRGTGERVECYDDLCHAQGQCMHGDNTCNLCEGLGRITEELADRWRDREPFEAVTAPNPDMHARGELHQVARERHGRVVGVEADGSGGER